jgi:hypothetical protein
MTLDEPVTTVRQRPVTAIIRARATSFNAPDLMKTLLR